MTLSAPNRAAAALQRRLGLGRHQAYVKLAGLTDGEVELLAELDGSPDFDETYNRISDRVEIRRALHHAEFTRAEAEDFVDSLSEAELARCAEIRRRPLPLTPDDVAAVRTLVAEIIARQPAILPAPASAATPVETDEARAPSPDTAAADEGDVDPPRAA